MENKKISKLLATIALITLITISSAVFALYQSPEKLQLHFPTENETREQGIPVVEKFMALSVQDWVEGKNTDAERFTLISQEYLSSQDINPDFFQLNDYGFDDFKIIGIKRNHIKVKGFNRSNGWARIVTFRMLIENGSFVILPSKVSRKTKDNENENYVTYWWMSSKLITEKQKRQMRMPVTLLIFINYLNKVHAYA